MSDYPEYADPITRPRYTGIPTFFRCPYSEDLDQVDIGVIGVPCVLAKARVGTAGAIST